MAYFSRRKCQLTALFSFFLILMFFATSVLLMILGKIEQLPTDVSENLKKLIFSKHLIKSVEEPYSHATLDYFTKKKPYPVEKWKLDNENIPQLQSIIDKASNSFNHSQRSNCANYPSLYTIHYSNVHWQVQATEAETFYFYAAYLDVRGKPPSPPEFPYDSANIRVIGMSDAGRLDLGNSTLKACQLWFENRRQPEYGTITDVKMIWHTYWGKGAYFPYLITCELPTGLKEIPKSISLISSYCQNATNNLKIHHQNRPNLFYKITAQKEIAVCVKPLALPNANAKIRLMEWIETLRLLGVNKIFFYEYYVDDKIKAVLNYYQSQGIVVVRQTTLPGVLPNHPKIRDIYIRGRSQEKRLAELVPYNDCFYRNMYDYKYIAVLDIDELIVPTENITLSNLMHLEGKSDLKTEAEKLKVATFCFRNFYFLESMLKEKEDEVSHIPSVFHMLRHIYRAKVHTDRRFVKCFHSTTQTLAVHNHFAVFCRDSKNCNYHVVDTARAQLNHYRQSCAREMRNCSAYILNSEKDTKLWRYKEAILTRVQNVLNIVSF